MSTTGPTSARPTASTIWCVPIEPSADTMLALGFDCKQRRRRLGCVPPRRIPAWISPIYNPVQSQDPNAISGPSGVGAAQYVSATEPIGYSIFPERADSDRCRPPGRYYSHDRLPVSIQPLSRWATITFPGFPGVLPPSVPLQGLGQFSNSGKLDNDEFARECERVAEFNNRTPNMDSRRLTPRQVSRHDPSLGVLPPAGMGRFHLLPRVLLA